MPLPDVTGLLNNWDSTSSSMLAPLSHTVMTISSAVEVTSTMTSVTSGLLVALGAIILTKLIYELHHREARYGLATMCIGGGQGIAVIVDTKI